MSEPSEEICEDCKSFSLAKRIKLGGCGICAFKSKGNTVALVWCNDKACKAFAHKESTTPG